MRDISLMIDNTKLNIRVGVIFKYHKKVLIELSKTGNNSVIPGGRVKIGEETKDSLIREIKEEMNFDIDKEKLEFKEVLENFFTSENINVHELFFVYEYHINDNEYSILSKIKNNIDNKSTYFEFIDFNNLHEINLLPLKIIDIIKVDK